jgi:hypothetical protein
MLSPESTRKLTLKATAFSATLVHHHQQIVAQDLLRRPKNGWILYFTIINIPFGSKQRSIHSS